MRLHWAPFVLWLLSNTIPAQLFQPGDQLVPMMSLLQWALAQTLTASPGHNMEKEPWGY